MLFRLHETEAGGTVEIDGRDIKSVGLQSLRKAITVIPQDPSLMEGSFRDNLDPFGQCDDAQVRAALTKATLDPELIFTHVDKGTPLSRFADVDVSSFCSRYDRGARVLLLTARQHLHYSSRVAGSSLNQLLTFRCRCSPTQVAATSVQGNGSWCALHGLRCTRRLS
jgi:hypothetical protein